jgi:FemAB-related protein (PEP-CTERM system-associated)
VPDGTGDPGGGVRAEAGDGAPSVCELAPDARGHGFDEFVERHAGGTLFHTTIWRDLVCRHFSHRPRYLEARRGSHRVGVLPLFETRSPLSGRALVSVPYAVYGGPLASDAAAARALLDAVRARVGDRRARFAELRFRELPTFAAGDGGTADAYAALPGSDRYCTFLRALPDDPEACLEMIPRKSRASTRQARDRHQLEFVEAPRQVAAFHRLFVLNKQRLGSPGFSLAWFEDLLRLGDRRARLHFVTKDGRPLVGVLSLLYGDTWNPYYSGSLAQADALSASNFAYWQLMRTATAAGFRRFDFGRSRFDGGPYHFKRNMGFEPAALPYRYLLAPGATIPDVQPGNPRFTLPRLVISKLPFAVARAVGPRLMGLVP